METVKSTLKYLIFFLLTVAAVFTASGCGKDEYMDVKTSFGYLSEADFFSGEHDGKIKDKIETAIDEKSYVVIDFALSNIDSSNEGAIATVSIDFSSQYGDDFDFNVEDFPTSDYSVIKDKITARVRLYDVEKKEERIRFIVSVTKKTEGVVNIAVRMNGYSETKGRVSVLESLVPESRLEYQLSTDGSYYTVTGVGKETGDKIRIPATYKDVPVKEIANNAFFDVSYINDVIIPNGIEKIGESAFKGCTKLDSIVIPSTVTYIGKDAFSISPDAVIWCVSEAVPSGWNDTWKPETAEVILGCGQFFTQNGATCTFTFLDDKINVKSLNIPETYLGASVTEIKGNGLNADNTVVRSITVPSGVIKIEEYAFANCTALISINFNAVKCASLTFNAIFANAGKAADGISVTFGDSVKIVPSSIFSMIFMSGGITYDYRANIKSVSFGKNVNTIGSRAFTACDSITGITIPGTVKSIEDGAFKNCAGITSITLGEGIEYIGSEAFYGTEYYGNAANWENGVLYMGKYLMEAAATVSGSYTVKDGTTFIASNAFKNNAALTEIIFPNSLTDIGGAAFFGCDGLTSVVIPDSVTSLGGSSFSNCDGLKSVKIGNGVTDIKESAFYECKALTDILIGSSVSRIGEYALYDCDSLKTIKFSGSKQQWIMIYKESCWDYQYNLQNFNQERYKIKYNQSAD